MVVCGVLYTDSLCLSLSLSVSLSLSLSQGTTFGRSSTIRVM